MPGPRCEVAARGEGGLDPGAERLKWEGRLWTTFGAASTQPSAGRSVLAEAPCREPDCCSAAAMHTRPRPPENEDGAADHLRTVGQRWSSR